MPIHHTVLFEGSFRISGALEQSDALVATVLEYLGVGYPKAVTVHGDRFEVEANIVPDAGRGGTHLLSFIRPQASRLGIQLADESVRVSDYRIEKQATPIRLGDDLDYSLFDWDGSAPDTIEAARVLYPGAELLATEHRAQIWRAERATYENGGLSAFARHDAYKIAALEKEVWIPGQYCTAIDGDGRPI